MAFTLKFETGNAAFTADPGKEIARIIYKVAMSIGLSDIPLNGEERHLIRDINGNTVGKWEYTPQLLEWECPRCNTINADEANEPGEMTCVDCDYTVDKDEVSV